MMGRMRVLFYGALVFLVGIHVQVIPSHYDTVNESLKKVDAKAPPISQKSDQASITTACKKTQEGLVAQIKKAKIAQKAVLVADQSKVAGACAVLVNPAARKKYDATLKEDTKKPTEKTTTKEATKKEPAEKGETPKKEEPTKDAKKEEGPKAAGAPKSTDPNYIDKMKTFLTDEFKKITKGEGIKVFDVISNFLKTINIPAPLLKEFKDDLVLKDPELLNAPEGLYVRAGLGFSGTAQFRGVAVKATVYIVMDIENKVGVSLGFSLPKNYKVSDVLPEFKMLDVLTLPQITIVASTTSYIDPAGFFVVPGFNFASTIELDGPLRALGELRKKAKEFDFIEFDVEPIFLQGAIGPTGSMQSESIVKLVKEKKSKARLKRAGKKATKEAATPWQKATPSKDVKKDTKIGKHRGEPKGVSARLSAIIPLRLGVDFAKVKQFPKDFTKIIKKITTDDFVLGASISPSEIFLSSQYGLQIHLGTQPDPVRIQAFGGIDLKTARVNFGGKFPDMLEMGIIAIGDTLLELYIDPSISGALIWFGIPFSGFSLGGRIALGKPTDTRLSLGAKTKISLEADKAVAFVWEVEGQNLDFANIVSLLTKMAEEAGIKGATIPKGKLPVIKINRAYGKMVPIQTRVANVIEYPGFQLNLDAELFDKKFMLDVDIRHEDLIFEATGYMSEIVLPNKNKPLFKLSGPGLDNQSGTPDDGPFVSCKFNARNLTAGGLIIAAMLDIPPLALNSKVDLEVMNYKFKADVETNTLGFTVLYGVNIDPRNWRDMYIQFGFQADFQNYLMRFTQAALQKVQKDATKKLAEVDKKVKQLSGELDKFKKSQQKAKKTAVSATQTEINKTNATIARIKAKIKKLKKECDDAGVLEKTVVCPKVGIEIAAQETALKAQEVYRDGLLKPGKAVVATTVDVTTAATAEMQKATKALADAKVFQKSMRGTLEGIRTAMMRGGGLIKVTEAAGSITMADLLKGKAPELVSLKAEVTIPGVTQAKVDLQNVQFDFTKPQVSAIEIVKQLFAGVKIG